MHHQFLENLYEKHKVGIFRYALSIVKSPQLAEDVLQDTFVKLIQQESLPMEPGKEAAWLYRVARNLCFDILRRQKKEAEPVEAGYRDQLAFLDLIRPLSDKEKEIVSLKILGNLTHKEIAQVMGLTVHGAKKRYERAIGKLRSGMKEDAL